MPKLWIDKLEDAPEAWRDEYAQQPNGKFKLKGDDFDGVDDPQAMKRSLGQANNEAGNRRKAIEKWEALGKTPEEIQQLLDAQKDDEQKKLEQKGEWETLRNQMNEQHKTERDRLAAERDAATADADNYILQSEASKALADNKGNSRVLLPHVLSRVKVMKDDAGKRVVRVLGDDGNPRVNANGQFLGVNDFVGEMRKDKDFAHNFEGPSGSGGGAAGGGGGGGTPQGDKKRSQMSVSEKAKFVGEHGQEAYLQLPA